MEATDAEGNVYYIHSLTGEMQWERPASPSAHHQQAQQYGQQYGQQQQQQYGQQQQQLAWQDDAGAAGDAAYAYGGGGGGGEWLAEDDGYSNTYYRNTATGQTQWEPPPGWEQQDSAWANQTW